MTLADASVAPAYRAAPTLPDTTWPATADPRPGDGRPRTDAKFLAVGDERLWVRGVTYGTFAPDAEGCRFPSRERVSADFADMIASGINAVRVYTAPPRWVLDTAAEAGLWVMVGLPWEQHVAFLQERERARSIVARLRADVASCAGHPALLCFAIGNEIPAAIVRWHGRRRVEKFLQRLCAAARAADPGALLTYVNFPSTEYLRLPFVDVMSFNVYLEDRDRMAAYVARLQNLAGEHPLLLAEIGLDSRRNGVLAQADSVRWQVDAAFAGGCAGGFVFSWTDEWHRGEDEILDWDFGLTDRDRRPKPALGAIRAGFTAPLPAVPDDPPKISVVVCTYNGAATLRYCLEGVAALRYPDHELLLIDDGSTDGSAAIGAEYGARVISGPNRGLSAARNIGMDAARGEIVAYLDDDACPDPDWLTYLAASFRNTDYAAVGGPNIPPLDETGLAACVANSPGGPTHVLVSDTEAEHLPGCNVAFRRDALRSIGGFDPQFRVAGDDVDVCWRLREAGLPIGFHPAAQVWHRRRATIGRYWRQQRGYGRAEALLERKWPEKYNAPGHPTWGGRLYGRGVGGLVRRTRIYHGVWGAGAFQSAVEVPGGRLSDLAAAPEAYLVMGALGALTLLGTTWPPLLATAPLLVMTIAAVLAHAVRGARAASFGAEGRCRRRRLGLQAVTLVLHLIQPAARLAGRTEHGLVPWRRPRLKSFTAPRRRRRDFWSDSWQAPEQRLRRIERALRDHGGRVQLGGACDRWDMQIAGGVLGAARLRTAIEDHGRGRQLLRADILPCVPRGLLPAVAMLAAGGVVAVHQQAWFAGAVLVTIAVTLLTAAVCECGIAISGALRAVAGAMQERPHLEAVKEPGA